jgi:hypothetical protein
MQLTTILTTALIPTLALSSAVHQVFIPRSLEYEMISVREASEIAAKIAARYIESLDLPMASQDLAKRNGKNDKKDKPKCCNSGQYLMCTMSSAMSTMCYRVANCPLASSCCKYSLGEETRQESAAN